MSNLEDINLDELREKAGSLQNGRRGDKDVMNDVIALTAKMLINLYHKINELQDETNTRLSARRKFWRNNCWNLVSSTITAAVAAVVVTWINGK